MTEKFGPSMRVDASCYGCSHRYSNRVYLEVPSRDEDPDGLCPDVRDDHYCRALKGDGPNLCGGGKLIGSQGATTPKWCPYLKSKIQELVTELEKQP